MFSKFKKLYSIYHISTNNRRQQKMESPTESSKKTKQRETEFREFLNSFKIGKRKDITITHTSMGSYFKGSWHIPEDKYNDFLEKYSKLSGKVNLSIVERPLEVGPMLFDIDMNFDGNVERQYTIENVRDFVSLVQNVITRNIKLKKDKDVKAFVCEKPEPTFNSKKNITKDGFHVMFPYLYLNIEQRTVIMELSKETAIKENLFGGLQIRQEGNKIDYDDIFDKSIIKSNGWMLYKSRKDNCSPYELTHIIKKSGVHNDISKFSDQELCRLLNNRKYGVSKNEYNDKADMDAIERILNPVRASRKKHIRNNHNDSSDDDIKADLDELGRMFESDSIQSQRVNTNGIYVDSIKNMIGTPSQTPNQTPEAPKIKAEDLLPKGKYTIRDNIYIASKLVIGMSEKRATTYDSWISVCWALTNISKENKEDLYRTWLHFSKKSSKFDKESCKKVWADATPRPDGYGMPTIHYWAKKDDPIEYAKSMFESVSDLIIKITDLKDLTEESIANIAYNLYKYDFVCSSIEKKIWYEFRDHRWLKIESGTSLREKIYTDLTQQLYQFIHAASAMCIGADGTNQEKVNARMTNGLKHMTKMGKTQFRENVMKECAHKFLYRDPTNKGRNFEETLDEKVYLIGFNNGIYDLERMEFREGHPDDYLTFSVGYDYVDMSESPYIEEINTYFKQVQPNKEMRKYVLTLLSTFLKGGNDLEQFIIWTGTGANGKSMTSKLLQETLGQYEGTLPSTFITTRQVNSSAATPELADKKGKRYIQINEPEKGEKIYCSSLKEKTSDKIMARPLYGNCIEYMPQFKCIVNCNDLLELSSNDGGVWRRIRVTHWTSEFVYVDEKGNHRETKKTLEPHQFKRDDKLKERVPLWAPTFMWMLINIYYKKFKDSGFVLHEPEQVKQSTNQYRETMDIFAKFIGDLLEPDNVKGSKGISIDDIYEKFTEWVKNNVNVKKMPKIPDLKKYLLDNKYKIKRDDKVMLKYKDKMDEFESGSGEAGPPCEIGVSFKIKK